MSGTAYSRERVIRVGDIDPQHRQTVIRQLFEHLPQGGSLQLVVDHDPKYLRSLLEAPCASCCEWTYLDSGPSLWRVRLRRWAVGG